MCITYIVEDKLYVNITNKCSNRCEFCIRNNGDGAYGSDSLWLEREPTREEILGSILSRDLTVFPEIVFCGYGEPSYRLDDAVYVLKDRANREGIEIFYSSPEYPAPVNADPDRIKQVFVNIIDNAIKYTAENGEIRLLVTTEQDVCRIAVTNTCVPLTDHQLENLFISFYKADESRHLEQQSFGLGLAIVKATMDLHGQICEARNTQNGLQIAFTLPLVVLDEEE